MTGVAKPWDGTLDDDLVERLILALQRTSVEIGAGEVLQDGRIAIPAPELSAALINLLASVLEQSPACETAGGMRKVAKGAGEDLLVLMRELRRMR